MGTEFRNLMEEYTVFLEEMVEREKEKYAALVSYDPKRTDKAVAEQQAFNMRLASAGGAAGGNPAPCGLGRLYIP